MSIRKFKITYVVLIIFLLDSTGLNRIQELLHQLPSELRYRFLEVLYT